MQLLRQGVHGKTHGLPAEQYAWHPHARLHNDAQVPSQRADKEEIAPEKEDGGDSQDQHAQSEAVQLPEAYKSRDDKRLPGIPLKIILSQSP